MIEEKKVYLLDEVGKVSTKINDYGKEETDNGGIHEDGSNRCKIGRDQSKEGMNVQDETEINIATEIGSDQSKEKMNLQEETESKDKTTRNRNPSRKIRDNEAQKDTTTNEPTINESRSMDRIDTALKTKERSKDKTSKQRKKTYKMGCTCENPDDETKTLMQCGMCTAWFHCKCVPYECEGCVEKKESAQKEYYLKLVKSVEDEREKAKKTCMQKMNNY